MKSYLKALGIGTMLLMVGCGQGGEATEANESKRGSKT